ncbi:serine-rich and transmembrane domain-containing protein 1 isoform X1 [Leopardus geoffroyi]|uniref:serine-rich and transmembrane domain-containing protein 1 isoform X1 n=1 Tax=Leopardus geoffroyi TaxID=46844 RepID=UPI001E2642F0|nr:serine-rich and transmembrane domain-containing protein 1 isoform X1 [Leopardus geoffroyi]
MLGTVGMESHLPASEHSGNMELQKMDCSEELHTCSWFSLKKIPVRANGHLIPCCLCLKSKKFPCADLTACSLSYHKKQNKTKQNNADSVHFNPCVKLTFNILVRPLTLHERCLNLPLHLYFRVTWRMELSLSSFLHPCPHR